MNNYMFKVVITPEDIWSRMPTEQREMFNEMKVIGVNLCGNGEVEIKCFVSENKTIEKPVLQKLIGDWHVSAI